MVMTRRLENAIQQLTPDKLQELTDFAEFLAAKSKGPQEIPS